MLFKKFFIYMHFHKVCLYKSVSALRGCRWRCDEL